MKKKCIIAVVTILLVGNSQGMDGLEYLKNNRSFESITVTSTNLVLRFVSDPPHFSVIQGGGVRPARTYVENDEYLILPQDQETIFTDMHHSGTVFTPVSYKNQHKGFRIRRQSRPPIISVETPIRNTFAYFALSDTPMEVGKDDVERIWKDGDWRMPEEYRAILKREAEYQALLFRAQRVAGEAYVQGGDEAQGAFWDDSMQLGRLPDGERFPTEAKMKEAKAFLEAWEKKLGIDDRELLKVRLEMFEKEFGLDEWPREETPPVIEAISPVAPPPNQSELPPTTATETKPSTTLLVLLCGLATLCLVAVAYIVSKRKQK